MFFLRDTNLISSVHDRRQQQQQPKMVRRVGQSEVVRILHTITTKQRIEKVYVQCSRWKVYKCYHKKGLNTEC